MRFRSHRSVALTLAPSLVAGLFFLPLSGFAEPYEPVSGDTVLLSLSPALQQHWQQHAAPSQQISAEQRLERARLLLDDARRTGNTDGFGQAEALLQPLVADAAPAAEASYLMAYIKQHNHEFPAALVLLDQLLAQQPNHYAARLQRAQIHLVTANYEAARQDCQALAYRISNALVTSCAAQVAALSGHAEQALQAVQQMLTSGNVSTDEQFELELTAATITEQLGDDAKALALYLNLLTLSPDSQFVLQHLADLYLRTGSASGAVSLLQTRLGKNPSLEAQVTLLRALLASGEIADATVLRDQLEAQFLAASARGEQDFPHKEYARFALHVSLDYPAALQHAHSNWQLQKEPGDLLLLAETASAVGDEKALGEVGSWLRARKLQDHRIETLLRKVSL